MKIEHDYPEVSRRIESIPENPGEVQIDGETKLILEFVSKIKVLEDRVDILETALLAGG